MSEDPTQSLNGSQDDKLNWLISAFRGVDTRLQGMDTRLHGMDTRLQDLAARFNQLEGKVDAIDGRLMSLEKRVDERLRETRPIWESVQAELRNINEKVDRLVVNVKAIGRDQHSIYEDYMDLRGEQREMDRRIGRLESSLPESNS